MDWFIQLSFFHQHWVTGKIMHSISQYSLICIPISVFLLSTITFFIMLQFMNVTDFKITWIARLLFRYSASLVARDVERDCSNQCVTGGIVSAVFWGVILGSLALGQVLTTYIHVVRSPMDVEAVIVFYMIILWRMVCFDDKALSLDSSQNNTYLWIFLH